MKYVKLQNNKLIVPIKLPNDLSLLGNKVKRNPTEEDYLAAGFLPLKETAAPKINNGFTKSYKWVQTDSAIVKKWTVRRDMRPLSEIEISRMLIKQQINTLDVDDNTALRMKSFYPDWRENTNYTIGYKVQYNDKLYRVRQAHTSQISWEPDKAESLWEQINEKYSGTIDDAIPYDGNMTLTKDLYYTQNDNVYLCIRDTINPVYHNLSELVGLYVAEI